MAVTMQDFRRLVTELDGHHLDGKEWCEKEDIDPQELEEWADMLVVHYAQKLLLGAIPTDELSNQFRNVFVLAWEAHKQYGQRQQRREAS